MLLDLIYHNNILNHYVTIVYYIYKASTRTLSDLLSLSMHACILMDTLPNSPPKSLDLCNDILQVSMPSEAYWSICLFIRVIRLHSLQEMILASSGFASKNVSCYVNMFIIVKILNFSFKKLQILLGNRHFISTISIIY